MRSGYSPKDRFALSIRLIDFFNNTAVATASPVVATLEGIGGLLVASSIPRQNFESGVAVFDSVIVTGTLNQNYTLAVTGTDLPTLKFPVQVISCGPGYQRTSLSSDSVYRCSHCTNIGTTSVLAAAPSVECGSPEHIPYQVFGWILVVVYIVGLPVGCIRLVLLCRRYLHDNPKFPLARELYVAFQSPLWYFEVVFLRSLAYLVYFYAIYLLHYTVQPFYSPGCNLVEQFSLITLLMLSGLSLGDSMRTNFFSELDLMSTAYGFIVIGVVVVLTVILMQTERGNRVMSRFIAQHSVLALSLNNMAAVGEKVAQVGASLSAGNTPRGSMSGPVGFDGRSSRHQSMEKIGGRSSRHQSMEKIGALGH
ncbi:hypothetical protein H9P43_003755 [Blastocladiella emersonii ATCC 22665]|nr:hypothetical protein H9P43_003755 [Blastocladiella emersonii ATCC 22665]